jgi:hypothetical protein
MLCSGPFILTGNGFFASYAGLFMAFQIFGQAFLERKADRV